MRLAGGLVGRGRKKEKAGKSGPQGTMEDPERHSRDGGLHASF